LLWPSFDRHPNADVSGVGCHDHRLDFGGFGGRPRTRKVPDRQFGILRNGNIGSFSGIVAFSPELLVYADPWGSGGLSRKFTFFHSLSLGFYAFGMRYMDRPFFLGLQLSGSRES
jgi:hypothetical protein